MSWRRPRVRGRLGADPEGSLCEDRANVGPWPVAGALVLVRGTSSVRVTLGHKEAGQTLRTAEAASQEGKPKARPWLSLVAGLTQAAGVPGDRCVNKAKWPQLCGSWRAGQGKPSAQRWRGTRDKPDGLSAGPATSPLCVRSRRTAQPLANEGVLLFIMLVITEQAPGTRGPNTSRCSGTWPGREQPHGTGPLRPPSACFVFVCAYLLSSGPPMSCQVGSGQIRDTCQVCSPSPDIWLDFLLLKQKKRKVSIFWIGCLYRVDPRTVTASSRFLGRVCIATFSLCACVCAAFRNLMPPSGGCVAPVTEDPCHHVPSCIMWDPHRALLASSATGQATCQNSPSSIH